MNGPSVLELTRDLNFLLEDGIFSLEITTVSKVLDDAVVTCMPHMPAYLLGVINLRGSVVPVVDLRLKIGMPAVGVTVSTCIVIVEATLNGEPMTLGLLADAVQEVFELDRGSIQPALRTGTTLETGFIKGMGRQKDRFIILDIDRIFS